MERGNRREVEGIVISHKMKKTTVVNVRRRIRHPLYKKYIVKAKKYYAHDEKGEAHEGDIVRLVESRPMSKLKRWRLEKIIRKSVQ